MKVSRIIGLGLMGIMLMSASVSAQETETKVVDEVVAQVNDSVITLSGVKREGNNVIEEEMRRGAKREDAEKLVEQKRGEMIANLINEELLIQKSKELGIDDVEAEINKRFVEIMKQENIKTLEALYDQMRQTGIDPMQIRDGMRKNLLRDKVIQREVQAKVYWSFNGKQVKDYYEKNKSKFTKPEMLGLSELYLSFAGRDPAAVRTKAKEIVAKARGGAEFGKLVAENSDRTDAAKTFGKFDAMPARDLNPLFAKALAGLKAGSVTDPIEVDDTGLTILRIDERTDASSESQFDESTVRMAMMNEVYADEQKKFMSLLREQAYIKISDTYRPLVSPLLFANERTAKPGN